MDTFAIANNNPVPKEQQKTPQLGEAAVVTLVNQLKAEGFVFPEREDFRIEYNEFVSSTLALAPVHNAVVQVGFLGEIDNVFGKPQARCSQDAKGVLRNPWLAAFAVKMALEEEGPTQ
jgi:hypothetical protein